MKRMKSLLSVVLALALIFSLSLTVFAAGGNIIVAEPTNASYSIYKVFDAEKADSEYTYKVQNQALVDAILNEDTGFKDLVLTKIADAVADNPETTTVDESADAIYTVKPTATFSAAEFSTWLSTRTNLLNQVTVHHDAEGTQGQPGYVPAYDQPTFTAAEMGAGVPVTENGYFYITYDSTPYALTTVYDGDVQIQNKNDMTFKKEVKDAAGNNIDSESVQAGDVLTYVITGKVPNSFEGNTQYLYKVWDILSAGLSYNDDVVVAIDGHTVTLASVQESIEHPVDATPKGSKWENSGTTYTTDRPTFVVNLDLYDLVNTDGNGIDLGDTITITYHATVVADLGVLVNTAHLVSTDLIKDAQTQNYTNQITLDKYETGNASQKLSGAQFVLYKLVPVTTSHTFTGASTATTLYKFTKGTDVFWNTKEDGSGAWYDNNFADAAAPTDATAAQDRLYYKITGTTVSWVSLGDNEDATAVTAAAEATPVITVKETGTDGSADFTGLEDGTYYLIETKAPDGYVKLETPVEVIVNGKASLDPNNTVEDNPTATTTNQNLQLTNVSHVANTPGSVLPSTGGRGTTMLYLAGMGMMLAAGAFLIFRRRAEAGK